ncbi:MAG: 50S ribosomal protein L29 [Acidobacteriota bacterium]|nr:50S ribosomal protein L29 [Acidobacteriota bacterium]
MKADILRDLSPAELAAKSEELREQLLKLRFQQTTGQIENPQMLRGIRRDIARVMTVFREKELGVEVPLAPTETRTTSGNNSIDTELEQIKETG